MAGDSAGAEQRSFGGALQRAGAGAPRLAALQALDTLGWEGRLKGARSRDGLNRKVAWEARPQGEPKLGEAHSSTLWRTSGASVGPHDRWLRLALMFHFEQETLVWQRL